MTETAPPPDEPVNPTPSDFASPAPDTASVTGVGPTSEPTTAAETQMTHPADDPGKNPEEGDVEMSELPGGRMVRIVTVIEDIVRRGQVLFTKGDRIHADSIKDLGISEEGKDLGDPTPAAQATGSLPFASSTTGHHPDALADAQAANVLSHGQTIYAAPGEPLPDSVPPPSNEPTDMVQDTSPSQTPATPEEPPTPA